MKLGFIVPQTHVRLLTKLVGQFSQIEITPIIYDAIFDIPFCIEGRQQEFDQLLFLGETAKLYTQAKVTPSIPWEFVEHSHAGCLNYLFQLTLQGHNIYHLVTDIQDHQLVFDIYEELGIPLDQTHIVFAPVYDFNEAYIEETLQFFKNQYRFNKDIACLTKFAKVYEPLKKLGYPVACVVPTLLDIYNSLQKVYTTYLFTVSRESQFVIIYVGIDDFKNDRLPYTERNEYQGMLENVNVIKHIYDLSVEIESPVFHVTEQLFMFFTSRDIIERRTRGLEDFSMFETIRENTASTISVSIGFGRTAIEAQYHARIGLNRARHGGGNRIYLVYDLHHIYTPIDRQPEPHPNISNEFLEISQRTGIGALTISHLHSFILQAGKNEFTTAEIADFLKITPRSAARMINKLLEKGYCFEVGKKYQRKTGRPSRILQFKL